MLEIKLLNIVSFFLVISCLQNKENSTEPRIQASYSDPDDLSCGPDQFKCLQLNLNQILTMHDWNRHPKKCIPQSYREASINYIDK